MSELAAMSDDVVAEILLNLPLKPLLRCTSVCKAWRRLISDDHFRRRRPLIASAVVYHCDDQELGNQARYASTATDGTGNLVECSLDFFPFHGSSVIIDSCNGLVLCCTRAEFKFYVVSPTTRRWTALPKTPRRSQLSVLLFDPCHSPDYKVVSFAGWRAQGAQLDVFSSDEGRWDARDVHWGMSSDAMSATIRYFDGALHILAYPNYVVQVDMAGDMACRLIELPEPAMKREDCLGKCGGRLHYAHADGDELRIWALTEPSDGRRWMLKHCMSIGAIMDWCSRWHGSSASSLLDLPLIHQFSFLAFHPEREEVVYIWVQGKLISYDLQSRKKSLEIVCETGKGSGRNHLLQLWLFPFSDYLSDCLLNVKV